MSKLPTGKSLADWLFEIEREDASAGVIWESGCALSNIAKLLRSLHVSAQPAERQVALINQVLFRRMGFKYSAAPVGNDFGLSSTLLRRRGSCLGLTTIYAVLGEYLSIPLHGLLFEEHICVCHVGVQPHLHIEASRGGAVLPERLARRMHRSAGPDGNRLILSKEQLLAVHLSNRAAFILARSGRLHAALDTLDRAVTLFPTYTAAWINRAAVLAKLGDTSTAEASLATALSLDPGQSYERSIAGLYGWLARRRAQASGTCAPQMVSSPAAQ